MLHRSLKHHNVESSRELITANQLTLVNPFRGYYIISLTYAILMGYIVYFGQFILNVCNWVTQHFHAVLTTLC